MEHKQALIQLGLTDKEAAVYLALLKLGEGSVQKIAKAAEVKRPTAYLILDELRNKGFVLKAPNSKTNLYIAKPPRSLYDEQYQKLVDVVQSLPALEALHKSDKQINTMYFHGPKGIKESLYYRLPELHNSEIVGFWAKTDKWEPQTKKYIDTWAEEAAEAGVTVRAIVPEHPSLIPYRKNDARLSREVRKVSPDKYSSNTSIEATDLFVRISQFDSPQAVVIESAEFVKTIREIFNMVWETQGE